MNTLKSVKGSNFEVVLMTGIVKVGPATSVAGPNNPPLSNLMFRLRPRLSARAR
jgi:hypothetical protein